MYATAVTDVLSDVPIEFRVLAVHIRLRVSNHVSQVMYSQYSFLLDQKMPADSCKD